MKKSSLKLLIGASVILILVGIGHTAFAYEYHLQFTPQSGARGLVVAGYEFVGDTVVGNCSYTSYGACSGRGCRPKVTPHYNTCTWDLYGNLLGMTAGGPTVPPVLYQSGTETVYASNGTSTTGADRGFGFVSTPSSHYTWQTPNGGYAVIPDAPYSVIATFISDGDIDLNVAGAAVIAQTFGTITPAPGSAFVSGITCPPAVAPGSTCSVTVTYNPIPVVCTASPYGYLYTGIDLSLVSDARAKTDFTQRFTVTGVTTCDDD